jgi:hypothetical protein
MSPMDSSEQPKSPMKSSEPMAVWILGVIAVLATVVAIVLGYQLSLEKSEEYQTPAPIEEQESTSTPSPTSTTTEVPSAAQSLPVSYAHAASITFERAKGSGWDMYAGLKKIATLDYPSRANDSAPFVAALTTRYAYVGTCPGEFGGYILFEVCPSSVRRVDVVTGEVSAYQTKTYEQGLRGIFHDVSPDGKWLAFSTPFPNGRIVLQPVTAGAELAFKVDTKYHQFGNLRFSPDGKKVAFAAALGEPADDIGFVIVLDILTNEFKVVAETAKGDKLLNVYGWKDANTVDYGPMR